MKLTWVTVAGIAFLAVQAGAEEAPALKAQKERMSYGIGVDIARNFRRLGLDLDLDALVRALRDVNSGGKLLLTEEELRAEKSAYQAEMKQRQVVAVKRAAEENRKAGTVFLAENKGREGVVTLPSGLQYKVLKAGAGRTPTASSVVECTYRGTLLDGSEFDSSSSRGGPAKLTLSATIAGLREALALMPVGSKWQIFIPPDLAYGERGNGRGVGPNETLVYEMELLAIK